MNKVLALVCVSLMAGSVYSAVARTKADPTPPKFQGQPGCYYSKLDVMLPLKQLYSPDDCECLGYYCEDGENIQIQSCGVIEAPGCTFEEDLSLPYPACCKKPVCPNNNQPISAVA